HAFDVAHDSKTVGPGHAVAAQYGDAKTNVEREGERQLKMSYGYGGKPPYSKSWRRSYPH
ncbi:MAG: hypothetical protein NTX50_15070, partial [Candidatus Sumerlaeota bacterium]|nr:hypothetical protein [Candidatus Sumerlaeota bacterium]